MNKINITIDGPAGAGKSTVAKIIADRLNYVYLDTGAMYRALTYLAIHKKIDLQDEAGLTQLVKSIKFDFEWGEVRQKVFCNGEDLTDEIRMPLISNSVSTVAKHAQVREEMIAIQRKIAIGKGVVMDGRDTGTWVLPDADYKFFLTASVEKRAERRTEELLAKGHQADLTKIKAEIEKRDKDDTEREIAPLRRAPDAIAIDTSQLTIREVVTKIIQYVSI